MKISRGCWGGGGGCGGRLVRGAGWAGHWGGERVWGGRGGPPRRGGWGPGAQGRGAGAAGRRRGGVGGG
ncbi:hypothetical protein, partial [Salmonella enterica]|uniref:hypothetical protein n=1 Tax=Salmonella enterica TaxID=28901 RepID=UPI003F4B080D